MTSPSADTMERARALHRDLGALKARGIDHVAVEIIAQALHDAQEEARREQREKDARWHDEQATKYLPGGICDMKAFHREAASAIRNQESST